MVRFGLNIKDLLFTWYLGKTTLNFGKHFLHPQIYALPYTYGKDIDEPPLSDPSDVFVQRDSSRSSWLLKVQGQRTKRGVIQRA